MKTESRDRTRISLPNSTRRNFLKQAGIGVASLAVRGYMPALIPRRQPDQLNVLFIAVDDLRPQLGCYGHRQMISPNIDRLADEGILFNRTYCQVPVCGASRASLLTGVRPTHDRFIEFNTWAERDMPGVPTLPRYMRENRYHTVSNGKIFHHQYDSQNSWSREPWRPEWDWREYQLPENILLAQLNDGVGPAYESADVDDESYIDGEIRNRTIEDLRRLKDLGQPFFLATGFLRPHLPFSAPKKYWDLYAREEIDLADNPFRPRGAPDAALHNWYELRVYCQIPKSGPLPDEMARTLIHGYYSCVSYVDAQIGHVLNELDELGLRDSTIVILWGDHGWNLGEHGLWSKHCNFETSLHSPMIIRVPGIEGGKCSNALTEYLDIYPTLCELCSLPLPDHLEGLSFVPLLENPDQTWKSAVYSRFLNGDSVKTDRYRYTEWCEGEDAQVYARMLYDHERDPFENENISELPENQPVVSELSQMIQRLYGRTVTLHQSTGFRFYPTYPNPFRLSTNIRFELPIDAQVRIEVFDARGRLVRLLLDKVMGSGHYIIVWDGKNKSGQTVSSGMYIIRFRAGDFTTVRKITRAK